MYYLNILYLYYVLMTIIIENNELNIHISFSKLFQDRRKVYAILENEGIEIPRYAVLDRDSPDPKRNIFCLIIKSQEINNQISNL